MNRREFLFSIAAGLIPKIITINTSSSLYGIPYHESNAHIGTWLGIDRSITPQFIPWIHPPQHSAYLELSKLIKIMEKTKIKN